MAPHSSVLAWRIPGTGGLVGCRLWGRTESDTTEATQQQQQSELPRSRPALSSRVGEGRGMGSPDCQYFLPGFFPVWIPVPG